ncbi:ABC transporter permease [Bacillaceae bacterium IKA-2]|nr:ABC transporter permease [Bacillaceae bacterium IKA-2]
MNNFWIMLIHTYMTKLKSKQFIISTVITLAIVVGLSSMTNIINFFNKGESQVKIAVIDETKALFEPLQEQLKTVNEDIELIKYNDEEQTVQLKVEEGSYRGLLILSFDNENLPMARYKSMIIADSILPTELRNSLQQIKTELFAAQLNLSSEQLLKLYEPILFEHVALAENAKTEEELNQARGLVYVLLFIIYFAVILYANMIAMEVAIEKSSRVMEILISSVSPIKQMFAKILGVGLLSLTQLFLMLTVGYFSIQKNLSSMEGGFFDFFGFNNISMTTIIYAVVFFILGYFLYATLAAFLGSLVSRIEDVQQMITPMTLVVVAGFMIAMFGLGQPDTTFITVASYIPFFTPMLMFMRVGMLNLPLWEPLLGIAILIVTIIIFAVFGARVYKGGVLMYGKSSSFKDIKKALQFTKKE